MPIDSVRAGILSDLSRDPQYLAQPRAPRRGRVALKTQRAKLPLT